MSDTPRTDAMSRNTDLRAWTSHAKELERENAALREALKTVQRLSKEVDVQLACHNALTSLPSQGGGSKPFRPECPLASCPTPGDCYTAGCQQPHMEDSSK